MDIRNSHESPLIGVARAFYRSGRAAYRQFRAVKNRCLNLVDRPLIILIYHRVTDLPSDPEMIAVTPENFRRHMQYLKTNFQVLRFEEEWGSLKEPSVVVTFDDGYADNALEALPILEEVGVPATFFVSSGVVVGGRDFWWHRLEALLLKEGEFPECFRLENDLFGQVWATANFDQRKQTYAALCLLMRKLDVERRENWFEQIENWAGCGYPTETRHRAMTRHELKTLAASPWATIGAHTVTHSALSALSEARQRQEIFTSKQDLETIIGRGITTFSYPFGRKCEYDRTSMHLCREAGFDKVAANFPGQVHRWSDPLQLPRHLVRNWDLETFAAELKGFWTR
ncbi:polysaccharide deacetylase family protein [Desulfuromonas sp. TF]|uniref:polysaccharide deacetylase family protein n=1 Tax=Desulfuromonas sp. TF TaxID=1232410 RepID=UPI000416526A|nr:polysaccharide deacetylase family protein [Desulfuromonas sp. TF]